MKAHESTFDISPYSYSEASGRITKGGKPCGVSNGSGYFRVGSVKSRVFEHRLVWKLKTGQWPKEYLDHIDGDRSNNRFENLREASWQQNNCNRVSYNNKTGEKNVIFRPSDNYWMVKIKAGKLIVHQIASHRLSAILAARLIRRTLHGEFSLTRKTV